jgi:hypothetical protein
MASLISSLELALQEPAPKGHAVVGVTAATRGDEHVYGCIACECGYLVTAIRADTGQAAIEDHRVYIRAREF